MGGVYLQPRGTLRAPWARELRPCGPVGCNVSVGGELHLQSFDSSSRLTARGLRISGGGLGADNSQEKMQERRVLPAKRPRPGASKLSIWLTNRSAYPGMPQDAADG